MTDDGGNGGHDCGSSSGSNSSSSSSSSSGAGSTSSSGGSSGGSSGVGEPDSGIVFLPPDGPGCLDSTCGGCGNDPSCTDQQQDYGDCGCTPPAPSPREAGPTF